MSGKIGSKDFAVLLVDGYDFLAAKLQSLTHKVTSNMEKSTGLGDTIEAMTPTGLSTLTVTQTGGFFDDTTNYTHSLLSTVANLAVSRLLVAAFAGNTIGKPFLGCSGVYAHTYEALGHSGLLTKANVVYNVSGTLDRGVIVQNSTAKTVDWNTKTDGASIDYTADTSQQNIPITSATKANPCVVTTTIPHGLTTGQVILVSSNTLAGPSINSEQTVTVISTTTFSNGINTSASTGAGTGGSFVRCSTVNGGAGYQAVSALSGFTGFIGKIRHSADDSTYATLITFTNVTAAPAAEEVVVAAGTTVNRYLCFDGDVTGSGSITPFAGFSRR